MTAGPGDVVRYVKGVASVASKEMFDDAEYEDLLRKSLIARAKAKYLDDGNVMPMSAEQEAELTASVDQDLADRRTAVEAEKARAAKFATLFEIDPENPQAWKAVTSHEGPPTATPDTTATLVPNDIPIEVLETEPEPPVEGGAATGATAGTPGTWTPSGSTVPANFAALSGCTASPTTAWTAGQYVVLGDTTQAHWNGTAWVVGAAPVVGTTAAKK